MGICRPLTKHRRIYVKVYAPQHYACALLYFTGSDHFNRSMRYYAKLKGYTLCDKGLRRVVRRGKARGAGGAYLDNKVAVAPPLDCDSERAVFDHLGLDYKSPHERNCTDTALEIAEAAQRLRLENGAADSDDDDDDDDDDDQPPNKARGMPALFG